ncbi:hypothetical protein AB1Y20_018729 [Prymnesium parvum]|uniref:Uncharacterized protein n=1 Tax=Prymnesium parvum TaxID=97485 RepID=A0AB34JSA1_PRYPA
MAKEHHKERKYEIDDLKKMTAQVLYVARCPARGQLRHAQWRFAWSRDAYNDLPSSHVGARVLAASLRLACGRSTSLRFTVHENRCSSAAAPEHSARGAASYCMLPGE